MKPWFVLGALEAGKIFLDWGFWGDALDRGAGHGNSHTFKPDHISQEENISWMLFYLSILHQCNRHSRLACSHPHKPEKKRKLLHVSPQTNRNEATSHSRENGYPKIPHST